jgi:HAE1 family hydrophobic/amphiphilic exporter-1
VQNVEGVLTGKDRGELARAIGLSLAIVFLVAVALFESVTRGLLVLSAVPLAAVGVLVALTAAHVPFEKGAYAGCMLLGGICVNASIILVSHIASSIARHGASAETVVQAAWERGRPVVISSMTTVVGMIPFVIGERGEEFWRQLGITVIGGVTSSSILLLLFVPLTMVAAVGRSRATVSRNEKGRASSHYIHEVLAP